MNLCNIARKMFPLDDLEPRGISRLCAWVQGGSEPRVLIFEEPLPEPETCTGLSATKVLGLPGLT